MPANTFNIKNPPVVAEAPNWDNPTDTTIGIKDINSLIKLIKETAEAFEANTPQKEDEIFAIRQMMGNLEVHIRGGIRFHNDRDIWVIKKTLDSVLAILNAIVSLKPKFEKYFGQEKSREIYHKTMNAFRFVYEPVQPDEEGRMYNSTGNALLPGQPVNSLTTGKNIYRRTGYVFVGNEPTESYGKIIDEIIHDLIKLKNDANDKLKKNSGEDETKPVAIKSRFKIEESRILFDDKDLELPTGNVIEVA